MTINILISTIDQGIDKVKDILQPANMLIKYIISHQYISLEFKYVPENLIRKDVIVSQVLGAGLAKSRNNALQLADGDIALLADDDIKYFSNTFNLISETFKANPHLDVACFKIRTNEGEPEYKNYPVKQKKLKNFWHHQVSSIEIAFRLKSIKERGIRFDERFGIGSKEFHFGEEAIFINDCIRSGLNVVFFPFYIVNHPYESTLRKTDKFDKQRIKTRAAVHARMFGRKSFVISLLETVIYLPEILKRKINPITLLKIRFDVANRILNETSSFDSL